MQAPPVRSQAETAGKLFVSSMCPYATPLLLPALFEAMDVKRPWQVKVGALRMLAELTRSAPSQLAACLPEIVPVVAECMYDAKQQVKVGSRSLGRMSLEL